MLLTLYGKTFDKSFYGSRNNIETMFVYDTFQRLTSDKFEPWQPPGTDYFFLFHALDAKLNLWNYIFYIVTAVGFGILYRDRKKAIALLCTAPGRLTLLSLSITVPYILILTFAKTKFAWYMAPVYGFIAFITIQGIFYISARWKPFKWITAMLFVFTFVRHVYYLHTLSSEMHDTLNNNNHVLVQHHYVVATATPQRMLLYFDWLHMGFNRTSDANEISAHKGQPLIVEKDKLETMHLAGIRPIQYFDQFCLAVVSE